MAEIESAWGRYPDYAIDLIPWRGCARVSHGDVLVAESDRCVRVRETRHVDRLYFPESDVLWEFFTATDHHTICPFKGRADYWSLTGAGPVEDNVVWAYRAPFPEVAGIAGHVCFYEDRLRVELLDRWPGDAAGSDVSIRFPDWGDAADLLRLIDVTPSGDGRFTSPAYETGRNVVEAGHQLAQSVAAASQTVPGQRVTSAHMIFSKAAAFDQPLDLVVEVVRGGRTFSTVETRVEQGGQLRSIGLLLMDATPPDTIRHDIATPDVAGPERSVAIDMGVVGRDLRVVDGAYSGDPDRIGPPELFIWCRFRDAPSMAYQHAALMAQSTTHWTIAAGMLPHRGIGQDQAHVSLSTGIMAATVTFLDEVDVTEWLLYTSRAVYAGRGLVQGEGTIHTQAGRVVGTFSVQSMVRGFDRPPEAMGLDFTNAM